MHLASCLPFEQAAHLLGDLLGAQVSAETTRHLTEQMGAWMDVAQFEHAEAAASAEAPVSSEPPVSQRGVVSVDGAMISLIQKQWVEVRTVAIGEPEIQQGATGEAEIHVGHLSYFSCLSDASTFTELAQAEMRRRKVARSAQVCTVTDGAEWCQAFVQRYRPDAVRILDFPHAAEHLSALLEGCSHAGLPLPDRMLSRCLHVLKQRGPAPLLRVADRLAPEFAQHKGVQEHVEYLRKREALMQYPQFRAQGWPIGSGMVESANKLVVQARLKGPGMHWARANVNPMLALRLAVCNDRWQEMWKKALACREARSALSASVPPGQPSQERATVRASSSSAPKASSKQSDSAHPVRHATQPTLRLLPCDRTCPQRMEVENSTTETPVCQVCGVPVVRVRGHRRRQYCSDTCRTRAYRARCATSSPRPTLPQRIKREALTRLPRQPITRCGSPHAPHAPFVKDRADRCPCGTEVLVIPGRGHRPRLYCSDRCRKRAHLWRQREALHSTPVGPPPSSSTFSRNGV